MARRQGMAVMSECIQVPEDESEDLGSEIWRAGRERITQVQVAARPTPSLLFEGEKNGRQRRAAAGLEGR